MRNDDEERSTRYAPRGEGGRGSSGGGPPDRDWKGRGTDRSDREADTSGRDRARGGGRDNGPSAGKRPHLEDMDVFRLAHDLAVRAHALTSRFPTEERGSLVALLRRASAAVPAQLAAGSSRWDRAEYRAAVTSARDAAAETRYFLLLTKDLGHLSPEDCNEMRDGYERVAKMLTGLVKALQ